TRQGPAGSSRRTASAGARSAALRCELERRAGIHLLAAFPLLPPAESSAVPTGSARRQALGLGALVAIGPLTLLEPRLAVFGVLLLVIGLAALTRYRGPGRKLLVVSLGTSLSIALVGTGRFVLREALPGILEAGGRATETHAVSRLREILVTQAAV